MPSLASSLALAATVFTSATSATLFTVTALQPNNIAVNNKAVNAAGGAFFIGLDKPTSECPTYINPDCTLANGTTFYNTLDTLWVQVPGGQQTFISPDGALGYTRAHHVSMPVGAIQGGWVNHTVYDLEPHYFNIFNWAPTSNSSSSEGGVLACPTIAKDVYQVNVKVDGFNKTDCVELLGLRPVLAESEEYGAWQYTVG